MESYSIWVFDKPFFPLGLLDLIFQGSLFVVFLPLGTISIKAALHFFFQSNMQKTHVLIYYLFDFLDSID